MFYDNLKAICDAKSIKITPLVAECGGAKGSISNWKKGASPNSDIVVNLAVRLNVPTDMLLLGNINSSLSELTDDEQKLLDNYRQLSERDKGKVSERAQTLFEIAAERAEKAFTPIISLRHSLYMVSAGTGYELDAGDNWDEIEVPDTPTARKADFCLTISGDSMEPRFHNGDIVLVKHCNAIDENEIGIFRIENKGYIKRYGLDRLISLNPKYDDILLSDYDSEDIQCLGLVIGRV